MLGKENVRWTAREPDWVQDEIIEDLIGGPEEEDEGDDGDALCCCQYVNEKGETRHLLELLCDCAALDAAADKLVRGQSSSEDLPKIWHTLEDRIRLPWPGGARKVPPDALFAPATFVVMLFVSSFGLVGFVISHLAVAAVMLSFHRKVLRIRPQSKFFPCWSLSAAAFFALQYEFGIVGVARLPRTVSFWENLLLVTAVLGAAASLFWAKRRGREDFVGDEDKQRVGVRYCRACRRHVREKDHHCVWLHLCVSRSNASSFCCCLLCLVLALAQFAALAATSACARSELHLGGLLLLPSDCRSHNPKFEGSPGWTLACAAHSAILAVLTSLVLAKTVAGIAIDAVRAKFA